MTLRSALCLLAVLPCLACTAEPAPDGLATDGLAADGLAADGLAADGLAGTSWRLVRIMSMDDRVDLPDDDAAYTLDLRDDGSAVLRADCNRGVGKWISEGEGRLTFGPIATTRAMCPPGSLSDRYLAQFAWVRSYVIEDGHLFLATMADGSIVEFGPAGPD